MKQLRKITALILCIAMMLPTQGFSILADTGEYIEDYTQVEAPKVPEEDITEAEERIEEQIEERVEERDEERIKETLPLETMIPSEGIIYWNPGGMVPELAATSSDAVQTATPSNARRKKSRLSNAAAGKDSASGLTPSHPVKTLSAALKRADKLMEEGLEREDIIIYAMNPMEISQGQIYVLNAANICIAAWPERQYDSDAVFYVDGGQLVLLHTMIESGQPDSNSDETELVRIDGGTLRLGQGATIDGRIVLDYRDEKEKKAWDAVTASDTATALDTATASDVDSIQKDEAVFDVNDYIVGDDEEQWEVAEDSTETITWKAPVIELLDGFEGTKDSYLLQIKSDNNKDKVSLVETLYADEDSDEAFLSLFRLVEEDAAGWSLVAESQERAKVRNTGGTDLARFRGIDIEETEAKTEALTVKRLTATRAGNGIVKYWNPGGKITIGGEEYPAGSLVGVDGNLPKAPYKTWKQAIEGANGGTIICMQSLALGAGAEEYLGDGVLQADGSYLIKSTSDTTIATVKGWEVHPQPVFTLPAGETLVLQDMVLSGIDKEGKETAAQTILCDGGDVVIGRNVRAERGYIQVNASEKLKEHPVKVNDTQGVNITLFFGGINDALHYRYTDIIVPNGELKVKADLSAEAAAQVGQDLMNRFQLELSNRTPEYGGKSQLDWSLRQDTTEDDAVNHPENLELYVDYYFNAVYLDGVRGEDTNFGANCAYPVKTWSQALNIWQREMTRSIGARTQAYADGRTKEYIERMYPLPSTIYVCGTLTVADTQVWDMTVETDYDGSPIQTEIVSHTDIGMKEDGSGKEHELTKTMISVPAGGNLTLRDKLLIRNVTNEKDSRTVLVEGGGKLTMTSDAVLTGQLLTKSGAVEREVTLGSHVEATTGASVELASNWTGVIERRQQGVVVDGSGTTLLMKGGTIQKNDSYDYTADWTYISQQKKGAGVVLTGGALFIMEGGEITDNKVYQYGAGVYVAGTDTRFDMRKGTISGNQMAVAGNKVSASTSDSVRGYGIGVYADSDTTLLIGTDGGNLGDATISGNTAYSASGGGIYSDGVCRIKNSVISDNRMDTSQFSNDTSEIRRGKGVGVYIGSYGTLEMDNSEVSGNMIRSSLGSSYYELGSGIGIYFGSEVKTEHYIKGSMVSGNKGGYSLRAIADNYGGGVCYASVNGNLVIEDTQVINNKAMAGGGIGHTMNLRRSGSGTLTIKGATKISENIASSTSNYYAGVTPAADGDGGGIYIGTKGGYLKTVRVEEGVEISDNRASKGGGIYTKAESLASNKRYLELFLSGSAEKPIRVVGNKSSQVGGGISLGENSELKMKHVEIKDNTASSGGGVYATVSAYASRMKDVIISGNSASDMGGGIHSASSAYMRDVQLTGNQAVNGGGMYVNRSNVTTYIVLSESAPEKTVVRDNVADKKGGGLYLEKGNYYWNFAGAIQNIAGEQGSNIYQVASDSSFISNNYILQGNFLQPNEKKDGVYNIYVANTSGQGPILDPQAVTIEKKEGEHPDAIYLSSPNGYLTYLSAPPNDDKGFMPIDLNPKTFAVGSVVIKPGNVDKISYSVPNSDLSGLVTEEISYLVGGNRFQKADTNLKYSSGGILPRRTQLGAVRDERNTALTNVVLVGEGVYLASERIEPGTGENAGGDDQNGGTSPTDAVATFARAKLLLEEQIQAEANNPLDTDGYSPFIYICGTVTVRGSEPRWELDYDDSLYTVTNQKYLESEKAYILAEGGDPEKILPLNYRAQIRRYTSFVKEPMITVGNGDRDVAHFELGKVIINGMREAVIGSEQGSASPIIKINSKSDAVLSGESQVANNYMNGIVVAGKLTLVGEENETNEQVKDHSNSNISLSANSVLEMQGFSKVCNTDQNPISVDNRNMMISYAGDDVKVLMKDRSKLLPKNSSGISGSGARAVIELRDYASITTADSNSTYGPGISSSGDGTVIELRDYASITGKKMNLGVSVSGGTVKLNRNADAQEGDSVLIACANGISLGGGAKIEMGKESVVSGASEGISVVANVSSPDIEVNMTEKSKITKSTYGVRIYTCTPKFKLTMEKEASISGNNTGFVAKTTSPSTSPSAYILFNDILIDMRDHSKISANSDVGIWIPASNSGSVKAAVIMTDEAVIGGDKYYQPGDESSGNGSCGIFSATPLSLTMSGRSKIDYNKDTGLALRRWYNNYFSSERGKIILKEEASISNNKAAITHSNYDSLYQNPYDITIQDNAVLVGNSSPIELADSAVLRVLDNSIIGESTQSDKRSINCSGSLILDGKGTIKGQINLSNGKNPLTLTGAISDPAKLFHLWLAEGFFGETVIQPDDPDGLSGGLTDVTGEIDHFIKDGAGGLAASKNLVKAAPNIILEGGNDVYLSGSGSDSNNGKTPTTAVATFKKAKELLQTGYYSEGANIYICGTMTFRGNKDYNWSFDAGGTVTNQKTGDTWKPIVMRYSSFTSRMFEIGNDSSKYRDNLIFKNITIDGGSQNGIQTNTQMMYIGQYGTALIGEGATIQNNTRQSEWYNNAVGIFVKSSGTLTIDGGTIRGMSYKNTSADTGTYSIGAVIYNEGTVNLKAGQIIDNSVTSTSSRNTNVRAAAVYNSSGTFNMSGGVISDNTIDILRYVSESEANGNSGAGAALYSGSTAKTTISGGIIRDNKGNRGSAICYEGSSRGELIISGGQIMNNTTFDSWTSIKPIYIGGPNFQLKGGNGDIREDIYLNSTNNIIKVSGNIYQPGRMYNIFLKQGTGTTDFKKGSVVVQPDGNWLTDASQFLQNFNVHANPYVLDRGQTSTRPGGTVPGVKEDKCLLLMQAIYLDSVKGSDTNNGRTPGQAVKTFTRAKALGEGGDGSTDVKDYYIIYVSGKATNTVAEKTWTLTDPSYMCRYTGFEVFNPDGSASSEPVTSYSGYLIEPKFPLTFDGISIYGRRSIDPMDKNGDSLIYVPEGVTVTLESKTGRNPVLGRNYNTGTYIDPETGTQNNLGSRGGAIRVAAGGFLSMSAGSIRDTEAAYGSAVYLEADKTDARKRGHFYLTGAPAITGKVYLDGTLSSTASYIEPDAGYVPASPLNISIGNDFTGRPVVRYQGNYVPNSDDVKNFQIDDAIMGLYDVSKRPTEESILELQIRSVIYLDGQAGDDSQDGSTPEKAFRTLKRVYEIINQRPNQIGAVVYIVGTVEVSRGTQIELSNLLIKNAAESHYIGSYIDESTPEIPVTGQVYFKRYAQPSGYNSSDPVYTGFGKPTLMTSLFEVQDGGRLSLKGSYVDGHSQDNGGSDKTLRASGVNAESPLVTVQEGGILLCAQRGKGEIPNGVDTATLFINNVNVNKKTKQIGQMDGVNILEGSGAGIELLGGRCELTRTEFKNLKLGDEVIGGTDVYSNGDLHFKDKTFFGGSVYLEGFGIPRDEATHTTSRYLTVDEFGEPVINDFQLLMRDSYNGRTVVHYAPAQDILDNAQIGRYRLEERVKYFFILSKRVGTPWTLELNVPTSVYIDGKNGQDSQQDVRAGSTPSTPVKSLQRAFELLSTRGGNTIYVVGEIQVDTDTAITGSSYKGVSNIALGSTDKVKLMRYIQPDFAHDNPTSQDVIDAGYHVSDYMGIMVRIKDGKTLTLGEGVSIDGHSEIRVEDKYPQEQIVSRTSKSAAPMIYVDKGATLSMINGVTLMNNDNDYGIGTNTGTDGGAIYNSGTTIAERVVLLNNDANKGAAAYQDGEFRIDGSPEAFKDHSFYLTTVNTGTAAAPIWGEDHILQTSVMMPIDTILNIDMDHAVKGRDVVKFLDPSAYEPDVDAEYVHFNLGSTVPTELFLVQADANESVLELQDWQIMKLSIPTDVYLVVQRRGPVDKSTKLLAVRTEKDGADGTELFTSPEYRIINNGRYDANISMVSYENQNTEEGILHDRMQLQDTKAQAVGAADIYLAIKGLDKTDRFNLPETALKPYAESSVIAAPLPLGTLKAGETGNFAFTGAVGSGFIEKYMDSTFPIEGSTPREVQRYIDGSESGTVSARAKYGLKYKLELVVPRR